MNLDAVSLALLTIATTVDVVGLVAIALPLVFAAGIEMITRLDRPARPVPEPEQSGGAPTTSTAVPR